MARGFGGVPFCLELSAGHSPSSPWPHRLAIKEAKVRAHTCPQWQHRDPSSVSPQGCLEDWGKGHRHRVGAHDMFMALQKAHGAGELTGALMEFTYLF